MNYRTLGKTNLEVSEIGLGTSYFGLMDERLIKKIFNIVEMNGINLLDTAELYGNGLSERLIGRFLNNRIDDMTIVTKVNANFDSGQHRENYIIPDLRNKIVGSVERLNTDSIDILLLHTPPTTTSQFKRIVALMSEFKKEGIVKFWGISATTPDEVLPFLSFANGIDVIEMTYNIIYQEPRISLFEKLKSFGIGIIAKEVLHKGALTGITLDHLSLLSQSLHKLQPGFFEEILNDIKDYMGSGFRREYLLRYALGFVLSDTSIHTALVGTSSPLHLLECINAYKERPYDPDFYERLRSWYQ